MIVRTLTKQYLMLMASAADHNGAFPEAKYRIPQSGNTRCTFSSSHPPVLHVRPGDLVEVDTLDCFGGTVTPNLPRFEGARETLNPVTGPIYVEGAEPGDILSVKLHDIRPSGIGVAMCCDVSGQLCHRVKGRDEALRTAFFDLSEDGGTVTMRDPSGGTTGRVASICFPASPMLGIIGVAPAGTGEVSTMPAGEHGGNLDNKYNGIGSTIHITVNHPGALLSVGDMHASQGDGEISGTGVEIGGRVLLSCEVIKKADVERYADETVGESIGRFRFPVTETEGHWMTHGVMVENLAQTTNVACEEAAWILTNQWEFSPEEAFMFLSVKGDMGFCQACHPDKGTQIARMIVPKIDACPRPFRCLHSSDKRDI